MARRPRRHVRSAVVARWLRTRQGLPCAIVGRAGDDLVAPRLHGHSDRFTVSGRGHDDAIEGPLHRLVAHPGGHEAQVDGFVEDGVKDQHRCQQEVHSTTAKLVA